MSRENFTTRDRILKSAIDLLEASEPQKTRMSDIAKKAGISRQAVYLHFPNRADLLVAAVQYLDEVKGIEQRLAPSRAASDGTERLGLWIEVWGNYIPEIHGVARALMALQNTDAEARTAWEDRLAAVRHGCAAVVALLHDEGKLRASLTPDEATALMEVFLSVPSWERLRFGNGLSQKRYIELMHSTCRHAFLES